jgi:hypothetical protein
VRRDKRPFIGSSSRCFHLSFRTHLRRGTEIRKRIAVGRNQSIRGEAATELTNKTDKLDAKGLAILLRIGTLPEVWIRPAELRQ